MARRRARPPILWAVKAVAVAVAASAMVAVAGESLSPETSVAVTAELGGPLEATGRLPRSAVATLANDGPCGLEHGAGARESTACGSGRRETRLVPPAPLDLRPVRGPITSGFGPRDGGMHTGVDIDADTGTRVGTAAAGRVVLAETYFGYGETVIVNHGGSLKTLYGHLSAIKVKVGDRLAAGDVVGLSGCTGDCTGDHLHFEVRIKDRPVDPRPFLPARFPPSPRVALDPGYAPLAAAH